jgi:hypothetical protein
MTQTQPAVVLTFDAVTRQSNRRRKADARARRAERRAEVTRLQTEADVLGLTVEAFEADAALSAHFEAVRELEGAYAIGTSHGRRALLDIINRYFVDGHTMGLDDAHIELNGQIRAAGFRG